MENAKLNKIKDEFEQIVDVIDAKFGKDYASKNPVLVQFLLDKIQQLDDRESYEKIQNS